MFPVQRPMIRSRSAFSMLELIYHSIVREIRKDHRNAVAGLIMNMTQTIVFAIAFYFMGIVKLLPPSRNGGHRFVLPCL